MATVTLMCDASFFRDIRLAGYAGELTIEDGDAVDKVAYRGAVPEQMNSNQAEMRAVICGLKSLRKHMNAQSGNVDKLTIHSDSMVTINSYRDYVAQKKGLPLDHTAQMRLEKYGAFMKQIDSMLPASVDEPDWQHVRSHVIEKNAERLYYAHMAYEKAPAEKKPKKHPKQDHYRGLINKTNKKLTQEKKPLIWENVRHILGAKIHIDDRTPIEKYHDANIDTAARNALNMVRDNILRPQAKDSPYYGAILPATPTEEQAKELTQLGYHLASKGLIARLAFDGETKVRLHPFITGIARYAKEVDLPTRQFFWVPKSKEKDYGNSCRGFDRILLRHHVAKSNDPVDKGGLDSPSSLNAGLASRVFFGPQYTSRNNVEYPTGRMSKASRFVMNLAKTSGACQPSTVADWVKTYSSYSQMPVVVGLNNAKRSPLIGLQLEKPLSLEERGAGIALIRAVAHYQSQLDASGMCSKIQETLLTAGYEDFDKPLLNVIEHFSQQVLSMDEPEAIAKECAELLYRAKQGQQRADNQQKVPSTTPFPTENTQSPVVEKETPPTLRRA